MELELPKINKLLNNLPCLLRLAVVHAKKVKILLFRSGVTNVVPAGIRPPARTKSPAGMF